MTKGVSIPVAVSVFPDEIYPVPRSWAENAPSPRLIHFNKLDSQAATSRRWNSPSSLQKSFAPASALCATSDPTRGVDRAQPR